MLPKQIKLTVKNETLLSKRLFLPLFRLSLLWKTTKPTKLPPFSFLESFFLQKKKKKMSGGGQKINSAEIAEPFRQETQKRIKDLGVKPLLVGFLSSNDPASRKYAQWTASSCQKDGIEFELRECPPCDLEDRLQQANSDPKVHGIIIYYPCFGAVPSFFGGLMDEHLRDSVAVEKDVEGLCYTYRKYLFHNTRTIPHLNGEPSDIRCLLPCTPLAIVKILDFLGAYDSSQPLGSHMTGKVVTVVNRSEIVGRPLSAMMANDGAEVFSVDIDSIYLMKKSKMLSTEKTVQQACESSQVIILGVPSKDYKLNTDWVKPGTIVINVSHFKNIDEAKLLETEGVKYVGAVGKVTIAMLERNLVRLVENFHLPSSTMKVVEAGGRLEKK